MSGQIMMRATVPVAAMQCMGYAKGEWAKDGIGR